MFYMNIKYVWYLVGKDFFKWICVYLINLIFYEYIYILVYVFKNRIVGDIFDLVEVGFC